VFFFFFILTAFLIILLIIKKPLEQESNLRVLRLEKHYTTSHQPSILRNQPTKHN